jgi:hypothetical protein
MVQGFSVVYSKAKETEWGLSVHASLRIVVYITERAESCPISDSLAGQAVLRNPPTKPVSVSMFLRTFLGLAATATTGLGASLQQVNSFGDNPTNIQMFIYVPDTVAPNPAIIVAVSKRTPTPTTVPRRADKRNAPNSSTPAAAVDSSGSAGPSSPRTPTATASSWCTPARRT